MKRLIGWLRLYWLAARLYDAYRPLVWSHTHGALVLVQTSYRRSLSLPGGGIDGGETPRPAAVRELAEELGLRVAPQGLEAPSQLTEVSMLGRNTVMIFALHLSHRPGIRLDGLELVDHGRTYLLQPG